MDTWLSQCFIQVLMVPSQSIMELFLFNNDLVKLSLFYIQNNVARLYRNNCKTDPGEITGRTYVFMSCNCVCRRSNINIGSSIYITKWRRAPSVVSRHPVGLAETLDHLLPLARILPWDGGHHLLDLLLDAGVAGPRAPSSNNVRGHTYTE